MSDKRFHPLVKPFIGETIVLADYGFRDKDGVAENMKICKKGTWNERMCVETSLSMVTVICDLKRIRHRMTALHPNALIICLGHVQCALGFVSIYSPRRRSLQDEHGPAPFQGRRILAMKSSTIG